MVNEAFNIVGVVVYRQNVSGCSAVIAERHIAIENAQSVNGSVTGKVIPKDIIRCIFVEEDAIGGQGRGIWIPVGANFKKGNPRAIGVDPVKRLTLSVALVGSHRQSPDGQAANGD